MMMTASLRLVKAGRTFFFFKKFNYTLCAIISLTFLIAVTPSGWQLLSKQYLASQTIYLTSRGMLLLSFFLGLLSLDIDVFIKVFFDQPR